MFRIITYKKCSACGEKKAIDKFNKDKTKKDGASSRCKACAKSASSIWYLENKERAHEWKVNRYWSNPSEAREKSKKWYRENTERAREAGSLWQKNNPEKVSERNKRWNNKNKEKMSLYKRLWTKLNPDKVVVQKEKRRAAKANGGVITSEQWSALKKKYNYTCLSCLRQEPEIKLTLDHVVPLSLGGKNVIENAQPLCQSCNSKKHCKVIDYR